MPGPWHVKKTPYLWETENNHLFVNIDLYSDHAPQHSIVIEAVLFKGWNGKCCFAIRIMCLPESCSSSHFNILINKADNYPRTRLVLSKTQSVPFKDRMIIQDHKGNDDIFCRIWLSCGHLLIVHNVIQIQSTPSLPHPAFFFISCRQKVTAFEYLVLPNMSSTYSRNVFFSVLKGVSPMFANYAHACMVSFPSEFATTTVNVRRCRGVITSCLYCFGVAWWWGHRSRALSVEILPSW